MIMELDIGVSNLYIYTYNILYDNTDQIVPTCTSPAF